MYVWYFARSVMCVNKAAVRNRRGLKMGLQTTFSVPCVLFNDGRVVTSYGNSNHLFQFQENTCYFYALFWNRFVQIWYKYLRWYQKKYVIFVCGLILQNTYFKFLRIFKLRIFASESSTRNKNRMYKLLHELDRRTNGQTVRAARRLLFANVAVRFVNVS